MNNRQRKAMYAKGRPKFIEYQSETKIDAEKSRKYFQRLDGTKIEPPKPVKMPVPHHGSNYIYWQIKRPVNW